MHRRAGGSCCERVIGGADQHIAAGRCNAAPQEMTRWLPTHKLAPTHPPARGGARHGHEAPFPCTSARCPLLYLRAARPPHMRETAKSRREVRDCLHAAHLLRLSPFSPPQTMQQQREHPKQWVCFPLLCQKAPTRAHPHVPRKGDTARKWHLELPSWNRGTSAHCQTPHLSVSGNPVRNLLAGQAMLVAPPPPPPPSPLAAACCARPPPRAQEHKWQHMACVCVSLSLPPPPPLARAPGGHTHAPPPPQTVLP